MRKEFHVLAMYIRNNKKTKMRMMIMITGRTTTTTTTILLLLSLSARLQTQLVKLIAINPRHQRGKQPSKERKTREEKT